MAVPFHDITHGLGSLILWMGAPKTLPEGPLVGRVERRRYARFVPPRSARLSIRRAGMAGVLEGDLVLEWLDVSEGGVKALLCRKLKPGDELLGQISYQPCREVFEVRLRVRYAFRSKAEDGTYAVGFAFVKPSSVLEACIREAMSADPAPPRPSRLRYLNARNK